MAVMVCGVGTIALDAPLPLRAIAAGGAVLWAPGYALTMVAFVPGAIGGVERAVLAFASSLALIAIPAILLDAIGVRLQTSSFLITACVLTSLAALLALLRLPSLADAPLRPAGRRQPLIPIALVIVGTALVLSGALLAARLTPQPAGIRGSSALAATSTAPRSVRAEVISAELETTKYRLTISTNAGPVELARFALAPGRSWRGTVRRPRGTDAAELLLYRGAERLPYRRVVVPQAPT